MFAVLHASAGAGKTHALVKHYLELCLSGEDPAAYRQALALTFTNKAAGEMKERVLGYLLDLAARRTENGAIADVMAHLQGRTGLDPGAIAHRADRVLKHMLHHWGEVAISTIDAFTRRVVRPFARDLQLDHDLRMTTDQEHYLNAAVEALVGEAGVDERVTAILTEACLQLLHEEGKWDPERPLRALAGELQKESALAPLARLRALDAGELVALTGRLRAQEAAFRRTIQGIGREALEAIQAAGLTEADIAHGKTGILGFFRKLARSEGEWEPAGTNARKPIETGKWYSGKADASAKAALERIQPLLTDLFERADRALQADLPLYLLRRAVARELPATFALHELDRHLEHIKQEDAVAFFSDLTRKVAAVVQDEPVPFIYERMGERYRHFLIDEFQDTSLLQWACLLPLIENALSTGGSALLVGDAKQAIYRWRNGEVRLFVELPKVHGRGDSEVERTREHALERNFVRRDPLVHNRRSSPVVVGFNNALFGSLSATLPDDLRTVYHEHAQQSAGDRSGLVELQAIPRELKGEDRNALQVGFVLQRVQEAIADGFRPGDVAVLVRTTGQGRNVAEYLVKHGFGVISPDGLKLAGDTAVELMVDLLRTMHAGDATAAARVLQRRARLHAAPDAQQVDPFAGEPLRDPVALVRAWSSQHGLDRTRTTLTELLGRMAHAVGLRPAEEAQVLAFLDEARAWNVDHGPDIGGFLEHWEGKGSDRSVAPPANGEAVQVMTVHKAKGLEFPVVILPTASMGTRGDHGERLWVDPRPAVPELEQALVRNSKALRATGLPELVEETSLQQLDQINLLYVAFTRPVHRLHVLVPEDATDAVTRDLLAYMAVHGNDGKLMLGERAAAPPRPAPSPVDHLRDVSTPDHPAPIRWRQERPEDWDPADPDPFRSFGQVVHDLLARVETVDDLQRALQEAVDAGGLGHEQAQAIEDRLRALLTDPRLAPWFGAGLTIRTEATIIDREGRSHRPDRVVIDGELARVLDIKTGAARPEHQAQVRSYMTLLNELGHAQVEGALLYVRDGTLEPVTA